MTDSDTLAPQPPAGRPVPTSRPRDTDVLGRRVVAALIDGGHVAVRTALRAVDGLPVCYLVGFVVMLATGNRCQRLGDLAASTTMVRAAPIRYRGQYTRTHAAEITQGCEQILSTFAVESASEHEAARA